MSQALYRKWRPQTWDAVIGQDHVIHTLGNALAAGRIAHAYLFAGPRGTGKTTTARLLAKAVNCLDEDLVKRPCDVCEHCKSVTGGRFLDMIEIDAASNTSVDDVRDLRDKINFSPNLGRYKVYIIDEVHMLSTAAFNALLKTLEEPPPHAIFVLATTEVHKIPATVLSRCQRHEFRRIPVVDIVANLKEIAEGEAVQYEEDALILIARQSTGAMRDAISLLDQLSSTGQKITLEMTRTVLGTAASQAVLDVVDALVATEAGQGLDHIHAALDAGSDPRQFARQIVDYLRELLLISMGNADQIDATAETRVQMARHAQAFEIQELLRVIRAFNHAATQARLAWQPSLPLEMAFVEALQKPGESASAPQTAGPSHPVSTKAKATPARQVAESKPAVDTSTREAKTPEGVPQESSHDQQSTQNIESSWRQILDQVRKHSPSTNAVLNSSKSRFVQDDILILNFASELLKSKMEKEESIEVVQAVLRDIFQREMTVKCYVDAAKRDTLPLGVEDDGMVASALRDLGGEIVDIQ